MTIIIFSNHLANYHVHRSIAITPNRANNGTIKLHRYCRYKNSGSQYKRFRNEVGRISVEMLNMLINVLLYDDDKKRTYIVSYDSCAYIGSDKQEPASSHNINWERAKYISLLTSNNSYSDLEWKRFWNSSGVTTRNVSGSLN